MREKQSVYFCRLIADDVHDIEHENYNKLKRHMKRANLHVVYWRNEGIL